MDLPNAARVGEVVRNEGPSGVARRIVAKVRGSGSKPVGNPYQKKRAEGLDERWQLIDSVIPPDSRSLLDIGCNLGDLTARAARRGLFSVGLDIDPRWPAQALERHAGVEHCAFMTMHLSPDNVELVPDFDVVLCLSVHHNWVDDFGPEPAARMLRELVSRTKRVFVFEGPARRSRYGSFEPDFIDNDEESVTRYYEKYLAETLDGLVSRTQPLGPTPNHDPEPFRWSWALHR